MPAHNKRQVAGVSGSGGRARLDTLPSLQEGGETVFPNADPKVTGGGWSECARQGFAVKAKRGDAVLFWVAAWRPCACCTPWHTPAAPPSLQRAGLELQLS